jgi:hypothetical protein
MNNRKNILLIVFFISLIVLTNTDVVKSSLLVGEKRSNWIVTTDADYEYTVDVIYEPNSDDVVLNQIHVYHLQDPFARANLVCFGSASVKLYDSQDNIVYQDLQKSTFWPASDGDDLLFFPSMTLDYQVKVEVILTTACFPLPGFQGYQEEISTWSSMATDPLPPSVEGLVQGFETFIISPCDIKSEIGVSVYARDKCFGNSYNSDDNSQFVSAEDFGFVPSSIYVEQGWSVLLTNSYGDYLCTSHSLWDLDQDYYNPNQGMKVGGNVFFIITYSDSTCGGSDLDNDGIIDGDLQYWAPQSAIIYLNGSGAPSGGSGGGSQSGHVSIFDATGYAGSKLGDYGIGTHTFASSTLMYSFDINGAGSFVVEDSGGNTQCFSDDVPNMQDHSSYWNQTVKLDVYASNVCGGANGQLKVYNATSYGGSLIGTYTAGNSYTFPVDTLMYSFDLDGANSFVVTAPDGRRQCFNEDVPNMQDHSEYWRETIKLEVNSSDLCPPSGSPAPAVGTGSGLWRNQFRILWEEVDIPVFDVIAPMQWGPVTSVSVTGAAREDQLGMRFEGCISFPAEDTYTFYLTSDDGSVLFIDGYVIIDNNGVHNPTEASGTINKLAGEYDFKLDYYENDGAQQLGLQVSSSTLSKQVVPESWYSYGSVCSGSEATTTDPLTTYSQMVTVEPLQSQAVITVSNVVTQAVSLLNSGVSSTNLVGYWDFNATSGTTFSDQIGTNHLAATSSGVVGNTGIFGNGLTADGTNYASLANMSGELKPADGDAFSISFWIDDGQTSSGTDYYFLSNFNTNSNDAGWWLVMNKSTGQLTYFYGKNAPGMNHATGIDIDGLLDGNRHHVVITLSGMNYGNNIRTYKDGLIVDDKTVNGSDSIVYNSSNTLFVSRSTIATIDDLSIFEQVLSSSEVQEIAQGGTQTGYENSIRFTSDVAGTNELTFTVSSIDYVNDVAMVTVDKASLDEIYVWHQNSGMLVGDPPPQPTGIAANWSYSQTVTINASEVITDMVSFPVLTSDGVFSSFVYSNAKSNGADLRFTSDSSGSSELSFEVVSWDSGNEESEVWVEVPSVSSSTNTSFYVWYGNATATAYADSDEFGSLAVWDNYTQVLHLDESANNSSGGYDDSSGNHSATGVSMSSNSVSHIGNGLHLDGSSDYLKITDNADFEIAEGSFSLWFVPDVTINSSASSMQYLVDKGNTYMGIRIRGGGSNPGKMQAILWDGSGHYIMTNQDTWNAGQAYYITLTWGSAGMNLYVDGALAGTNSHTGGFSNVSDNINLGRNTGNQYYFDGEIDEWRWSSTQYSVEQIETLFNNQNDPSTFFTQ